MAFAPEEPQIPFFPDSLDKSWKTKLGESNVVFFAFVITTKKCEKHIYYGIKVLSNHTKCFFFP